jgi:hypothetical protein
MCTNFDLLLTDIDHCDTPKPGHEQDLLLLARIWSAKHIKQFNFLLLIFKNRELGNTIEYPCEVKYVSNG